MIRHEATDGPYLRWLRDAERRLGPRVWRIVQTLDTASADAIMAAKHVVPWEHCAEKVRWDEANATDRKNGYVKADGPLSQALVTLTPVVVAEGWLSEVEASDPVDAPDPRRLTGHGLTAD